MPATNGPPEPTSVVPPTEKSKGVAINSPIPPSQNHRRIMSENIGFSYENGPNHYKYPPSHISYNPASSPTSEVPRVIGDALPQGHNRVRSWSGSHPYPQQLTAGHPHYHPGPTAFSPSGSPYSHVLIGSSQNQAAGPVPFIPHTQFSNSRGKRKAAGHRRVHSYSGASSYGSLPTDIPLAPSGPPPPLPTSRNQEFSPRSEFMKLTGGLRSSTMPPTPHSPHIGVPQSPQSSVLGVKQDSIFIDNRKGFSPRTPILSREFENGLVYGMSAADTPNGLVLANGISQSSRTGSDLGGEAVFFAQKKGKNKKAPSSRKMHMRQKSAQLFMEDVKGSEQIPACRDILFLLFFLFHLLGVIYLGNTYGYEALRYHDEMESDSSMTIAYQNCIFISLLSGVFAILVSGLALLFMMALARRIVQIALILTITLSFAWGTMGIGLSPKKVVPATGIIALALSVAYTIVVWDRCKFHGANLYAGLTGIRANPGAIVIAFLFQLLALGWSIYFTYVAIGVYDAVEVGDIEFSSGRMNFVIYSSLGISYYWTLQVFLNTVQVTVAGVIGAWWYTADGDMSVRTSEVCGAFFRSSFYSIGSICLGSLLVGPVRLLKQLSALFRPSEEGSSLLCLHECIYCFQSCLTSCVDSLAYRFNPWAFTYIGLYGYNLMDAGLHSTELFEKRGWSKIVSDDLVPNVLLLTSLVIGGVTGCFAHLIENIESLSLTSLNEPVITSFVVGASVGLVVSSVVFGIISSSVNAVIVCFAASPVDFHNNHPTLSAEMRSAWREVWPGCMDVVDMRVAVASYLDPAMSGSGEQQPLLG